MTERKIPELWWSPFTREVWWKPDVTSTTVGILTLADEGTPFDALPADAVRLAPADVLSPEVSTTILQLGRDLASARAERDALQARLDAALAALDGADRDSTWPGGLPLDELPAPSTYFDRIRAALQGDQPTEPLDAWREHVRACDCCAAGTFTPNPYAGAICGDARIPSGPYRGCGHARDRHRSRASAGTGPKPHDFESSIDLRAMTCAICGVRADAHPTPLEF